MFQDLTLDEISELDLKLLRSLSRVAEVHSMVSGLYWELDKLSDEVYGMYHGVLNHQVYEGVE